MCGLSNLDEHIVYECVQYLQPTECLVLRLTCRYLHNLSMKTILWIKICLNFIPGFTRYSEEELLDLLSTLKVPTYFELYWTMKNLQHDLFGFYRRDLSNELWIIQSQQLEREMRIICYQIKEDGGKVLDHTSFVIVFDPMEKCIVGGFRLPGGLYFAKICIKLKNNIELNYLYEEKSGHPLRLLPLPPVVQITQFDNPRYGLFGSVNRQVANLPTTINQCLGLFTAMYGPHGMEILNLSIKQSEQPGIKLLEALKVTGDPNVPAGMISFEIDLSQVHDPQNMLQAGNRPIFTKVHPTQGDVYELMDVPSRLPHVAQFYKGRGQINMVPNTWNPEWRPCSLIVYTHQLSDAGATCATVVWEDEGSTFRHGIDLWPLPFTL